jgi:hypothetical protein
MSIINYAQKEISFKIVYYGTGVAGKTRYRARSTTT